LLFQYYAMSDKQAGVDVVYPKHSWNKALEETENVFYEKRQKFISVIRENDASSDEWKRDQKLLSTLRRRTAVKLLYDQLTHPNQNLTPKITPMPLTPNGWTVIHTIESSEYNPETRHFTLKSKIEMNVDKEKLSPADKKNLIQSCIDTYTQISGTDDDSGFNVKINNSQIVDKLKSILANAANEWDDVFRPTMGKKFSFESKGITLLKNADADNPVSLEIVLKHPFLEREPHDHENTAAFKLLNYITAGAQCKWITMVMSYTKEDNTTHRHEIKITPAFTDRNAYKHCIVYPFWSSCTTPVTDSGSWDITTETKDWSVISYMKPELCTYTTRNAKTRIKNCDEFRMICAAIQQAYITQSKEERGKILHSIQSVAEGLKIRYNPDTEASMFVEQTVKLNKNSYYFWAGRDDSLYSALYFMVNGYLFGVVTRNAPPSKEVLILNKIGRIVHNGQQQMDRQPLPAEENEDAPNERPPAAHIHPPTHDPVTSSGTGSTSTSGPFVSREDLDNVYKDVYDHYVPYDYYDPFVAKVESRHKEYTQFKKTYESMRQQDFMCLNGFKILGCRHNAQISQLMSGSEYNKSRFESIETRLQQCASDPITIHDQRQFLARETAIDNFMKFVNKRNNTNGVDTTPPIHVFRIMVQHSQKEDFTTGLVFKLRPNSGVPVCYMSGPITNTSIAPGQPPNGHMYKLVPENSRWALYKMDYTASNEINIPDVGLCWQINQNPTPGILILTAKTGGHLLDEAIFPDIQPVSPPNGDQYYKITATREKIIHIQKKSGEVASGVTLPVGARRSSRQLAGQMAPVRRPAVNPMLQTALSDLAEIKRVLNQEALLNAAAVGG
jgi:hypothetical protein